MCDLYEITEHSRSCHLCASARPPMHVSYPVMVWAECNKSSFNSPSFYKSQVMPLMVIVLYAAFAEEYLMTRGWGL